MSRKLYISPEFEILKIDAELLSDPVLVSVADSEAFSENNGVGNQIDTFDDNDDPGF